MNRKSIHSEQYRRGSNIIYNSRRENHDRSNCDRSNYGFNDTYYRPSNFNTNEFQHNSDNFLKLIDNNNENKQKIQYFYPYLPNTKIPIQKSLTILNKVEGIRSEGTANVYYVDSFSENCRIVDMNTCRCSCPVDFTSRVCSHLLAVAMTSELYSIKLSIFGYVYMECSKNKHFNQSLIVHDLYNNLIIPKSRSCNVIYILLETFIGFLIRIYQDKKNRLPVIHVNNLVSNDLDTDLDSHQSIRAQLGKVIKTISLDPIISSLHNPLIRIKWFFSQLGPEFSKTSFLLETLHDSCTVYNESSSDGKKNNNFDIFMNKNHISKLSDSSRFTLYGESLVNWLFSASNIQKNEDNIENIRSDFICLPPPEIKCERGKMVPQLNDYVFSNETIARIVSLYNQKVKHEKSLIKVFFDLSTEFKKEIGYDDGIIEYLHYQLEKFPTLLTGIRPIVNLPKLLFINELQSSLEHYNIHTWPLEDDMRSINWFYNLSFDLKQLSPLLKLENNKSKDKTQDTQFILFYKQLQYHKKLDTFSNSQTTEYKHHNELLSYLTSELIKIPYCTDITNYIAWNSSYKNQLGDYGSFFRENRIHNTAFTIVEVSYLVFVKLPSIEGKSWSDIVEESDMLTTIGLLFNLTWSQTYSIQSLATEICKNKFFFFRISKLSCFELISTLKKFPFTVILFWFYLIDSCKNCNSGGSKYIPESKCSLNECNNLNNVNQLSQDACMSIASMDGPQNRLIVPLNEITEASSQYKIIGNQSNNLSDNFNENEKDENLIEWIRKSEFGIDDTHGNTVNRHHHRLSRAMEHFSLNLYSESHHFTKELIQNAEDNCYTELNSIEIINVSNSFQMKINIPGFHFLLCRKGIATINNENGFTSENIKAICDVGASSKSKKLSNEYIGKFGVGFKSVFQITDTPHIFSGIYSLKFNKKDPSGLNFLLPHDINPSNWKNVCPENLVDHIENSPISPKTVFWLPFSSSIQECQLVEKMNSIKNSIQSNWLLFLRKISYLLITDSEKLLSIEYKKRNLTELLIKDSIDSILLDHKASLITLLKAHSNVNIVELKKTTIDHSQNHNTEFTENQYVICFHEYSNHSSLDDISIGFPLYQSANQRNNSNYPSVPVFNYLPLQECGFKFFLNGSFISSVSRESIMEDNPHNQLIIEKASRLLHDSIQILAKICGAKFYSYIPIVSETFGIFRMIPRILLEQLNSQKWIPTVEQVQCDHKTSCIPSSYLWKHQALENSTIQFLYSSFDAYHSMMNPSSNTSYRCLVSYDFINQASFSVCKKRLNLAELSVWDIVDRLVWMSRWSKYNLDTIKEKMSDWISILSSLLILIAILLDFTSEQTDSIVNIINSLCVFPVRNENDNVQLVSPVDCTLVILADEKENDVFFLQSKLYSVLNIYFIHSSLCQPHTNNKIIQVQNDQYISHLDKLMKKLNFQFLNRESFINNIVVDILTCSNKVKTIKKEFLYELSFIYAQLLYEKKLDKLSTTKPIFGILENREEPCLLLPDQFLSYKGMHGFNEYVKLLSNLVENTSLSSSIDLNSFYSLLKSFRSYPTIEYICNNPDHENIFDYFFELCGGVDFFTPVAISYHVTTTPHRDSNISSNEYSESLALASNKLNNADLTIERLNNNETDSVGHKNRYFIKSLEQKWLLTETQSNLSKFILKTLTSQYSLSRFLQLNVSLISGENPEIIIKDFISIELIIYNELCKCIMEQTSLNTIINYLLPIESFILSKLSIIHTKNPINIMLSPLNGIHMESLLKTQLNNYKWLIVNINTYELYEKKVNLMFASPALSFYVSKPSTEFIKNGFPNTPIIHRSVTEMIYEDILDSVGVSPLLNKEILIKDLVETSTEITKLPPETCQSKALSLFIKYWFLITAITCLYRTNSTTDECVKTKDEKNGLDHDLITSTKTKGQYSQSINMQMKNDLKNHLWCIVTSNYKDKIKWKLVNVENIVVNCSDDIYEQTWSLESIINSYRKLCTNHEDFLDQFISYFHFLFNEILTVPSECQEKHIVKELQYLSNHNDGFSMNLCDKYIHLLYQIYIKSLKLKVRKSKSANSICFESWDLLDIFHAVKTLDVIPCMANNVMFYKSLQWICENKSIHLLSCLPGLDQYIYDIFLKNNYNNSHLFIFLIPEMCSEQDDYPYLRNWWSILCMLLSKGHTLRSHLQVIVKKDLSFSVDHNRTESFLNSDAEVIANKIRNFELIPKFGHESFEYNLICGHELLKLTLENNIFMPCYIKDNNGNSRIYVNLENCLQLENRSILYNWLIHTAHNMLFDTDNYVYEVKFHEALVCLFDTNSQVSFDSLQGFIFDNQIKYILQEWIHKSALQKLSSKHSLHCENILNHMISIYNNIFGNDSSCSKFSFNLKEIVTRYCNDTYLMVSKDGNEDRTENKEHVQLKETIESTININDIPALNSTNDLNQIGIVNNDSENKNFLDTSVNQKEYDYQGEFLDTTSIRTSSSFISINNLTLPEKMNIGKRGEAFVVCYLESTIKNDNSNKLRKVTWVNRFKETGLPYDIVLETYFDDTNCTTEYIEVKTSKSLSKSYFEISTKEWLFAQQEGNNYHIFRVFNINDPSPMIFRITNPYSQWKFSNTKMYFSF